MCRFLLVKAKEDRDMRETLFEFAEMAKESKTVDGDWQGDGWGVSWYDGGRWSLIKSLSPIWEEEEKFKEVPKTKLLMVHARSASFERHKGNLAYNQPYVDGNFSFVFNGLLLGVSVKEKVEGEIGAQKIWNILRAKLGEEEPEKALKNIHHLLKKSTRKVEGLNIGLSNGSNIYAFCGTHEVNGYFTLKRSVNDDFSMISSEPFGSYGFESLKEGEVVSF